MKSWVTRWPVAAAVIYFVIALAISYVASRYLLGVDQPDGLLISTAFAVAMVGVAVWRFGTLAEEESSSAEQANAKYILTKFSEELSAVILPENKALDRLLTKSGRLAVAWSKLSDVDMQESCPDHDSDADWPLLLAQLFDTLEQKQLVIIGEPGSGKTVMAVSTLLRLMPKAGHGCRVPVRFSMNSWNPRVETLHGWMWRVLRNDYPELEALYSRPDIAKLRHVITRQCILPVLDGLDEIRTGDLRDAAVQSIRQELGTDLPLIITSRTAEYEKLQRGINSLPGATIVCIRPLHLELALGHLYDSAPGEQRALLAEILWTAQADASSVSSVLTSPLMVWLTGVALDSGLLQAGDLVNGRAPLEEAALTRRLLAALVPGAFAVALRRPLRDDLLASQSDPRQAEQWLRFLAIRLQERGRTGIAWWQLNSLAPRRGIALWSAAAIGLLVGIAAGPSAMLAVGAAIACLVGTVLGFGFGYAYSMARLSGATLHGRIGYGGRTEGYDPDLVVYLRKFALSVAGTFVFAICAAAATVAWRVKSPQSNFFLDAEQSGLLLRYLSVGMVVTLVAGLAGGTIAGIILRSSNWIDEHLAGARAVDATVAVQKDKGSALGMLALGTVFCAILAGGLLWLASGHLYFSAIFIAITGGILSSLMFAHWPAFRVATIWFAVRDQLPLSLMNFLKEAHQIGVLRQTGNVYEFRHELLQEGLSSRPISDAATKQASGAL